MLRILVLDVSAENVDVCWCETDNLVYEFGRNHKFNGNQSSNKMSSWGVVLPIRV